MLFLMVLIRTLFHINLLSQKTQFLNFTYKTLPFVGFDKCGLCFCRAESHGNKGVGDKTVF